MEVFSAKNGGGARVVQGVTVSRERARRSEYGVARGDGAKRDSLHKSPALYYTMLAAWSALIVLLWVYFLPKVYRVPFVAGVPISSGVRFCARALLLLNGIFISYFWLNGVKDFLYVVWYYAVRKRLQRRFFPVMDTDVSRVRDKVLMAYCTCNDFDGKSLEKCLRQSYPYVDTVILDDSTDATYRRRVDAFAERHGLRVVRRGTRDGFKAGNINHYLMGEECRAAGYAFYVILDADEILPENYVYDSLRYFYAYDNVGIVQANHVSDRNRNFFMKLFHVGVNSHWPTYQTMKHFYGFSTMLGHGAMLRRECYEAAGGFPPLVAEDLCLSIEARNVGYYVAFAPNIVCKEEYPVDYAAFKKRHSKWTQGNLEFIKKYTKRIFTSRMRWFEKADIVLFTYNLPLTAVFAFFIFLNLVIAPLLHIDLGAAYAPWMAIPTVVFFFSPMLNDFISWTFRLHPLRTIAYTVSVVVLYGSMLTTSLVSATLGIFGKKAKFIVTPKSSRRVGVWCALRMQWKELLLSTALLALALALHGGALPVLLIVATGYASVPLALFANVRYTAAETAAIDRKTTEIALARNLAYRYGAKKQRKSGER